MSQIETVMRTSPVIPVLVIHDAAQARPLAEALVAGGLKVLEVTLRTPAALDAIREMKQVPGAIVGAGTVVSTEQVAQVKEAGAEFIVSPGLSTKTGAAIVEADIPWLPGVAPAGDIMRGLDLGLGHSNLLPAEPSGGAAPPQALAAPFYQCKFCPTGGITEASAPDWLAIGPVLCVGGSWVTEGTLPEIEARARAAASLGR